MFGALELFYTRSKRDVLLSQQGDSNVFCNSIPIASIGLLPALWQFPENEIAISFFITFVLNPDARLTRCGTSSKSRHNVWHFYSMSSESQCTLDDVYIMSSQSRCTFDSGFCSGLPAYAARKVIIHLLDLDAWSKSTCETWFNRFRKGICSIKKHTVKPVGPETCTTRFYRMDRRLQQAKEK